MQGFAPSDIFQFQDFRPDRRGGLFRCDDKDAYVPVAIGSRALDILCVLNSLRSNRAGRGDRLEGRDHRRRVAGDGRRGQQPDGADLGTSPRG